MVHVGTSGYNYPAWRGSFYPERLATTAMLPFYAERFETVEINASFYRTPTAKSIAGWSAATPTAFVFALKVPQRITHMGRLVNVDEPLQFFCQTARGLRSKLGPLLFQLPPTFRKDTGRLANVLTRVPADLRVAFEFRHPSWFCDEVYDVLRGRDAALCIVDLEEGTTPDVATASWGYVRLRDRAYTDAELDGWATGLARIAWRDAFAYLKHEDTGLGPALAARLVARLPPSALPGQDQGELQTDGRVAQ